MIANELQIIYGLVVWSLLCVEFGGYIFWRGQGLLKAMSALAEMTQELSEKHKQYKRIQDDREGE